MMPSTDLWPQSDNRDIGLGVTFFSHPYRSDTDYKIYHRHTHLPTLGYCPGCSSKAHLNLRPTTSSSSASQSSYRGSTTPATTSSYENTDKDELYPEEEDGILVNAETHHSGPSYTSNSPVPESESKRIELVAYMLDMWAAADAKKKEQQKKEQQKKMMADKQEQEWHEESVRRQAMSRQLDPGYEYGLVKTVRRRERGTSGDSHMMDLHDTPFAAGGLSLSSPLGITPTMQQYSIERRIQTDSNGQAVEYIDARKAGTKGSVFSRSGHSHKQHKNDENRKFQLKKKKSSIGLGLVAYGNDLEDNEKQSVGRGNGLMGYQGDSDMNYDVIIID